MSILDHFEGTPRPVQRDILLEVEKHWNRHRAFVITAPTAVGKTLVADCIASWAGSARIATPTNILVDQFSESTGVTGVLASTRFECEKWGKCSEAEVKKSKRQYCVDCPYRCQFREGQTANVSVSTYDMQTALQSPRSVHIFDEAHNLVKSLTDLHTKRIWLHELGVPEELCDDLGKIKNWLAPLKTRKGSKLRELKQDLFAKPRYVYEVQKQTWSGGGNAFGRKLARGHGVNLPVLVGYPTNLGNFRNPYWQEHTKVVLLSATIGKPDVTRLGLAGPEVRYINTPSVIPPERRPVFFDNFLKLNAASTEEDFARVAARVKEICADHPGESGLVHVTYSLAKKLKPFLEKDERFLFHTPRTKSRVLAQFKGSRGKVLVASGLAEGVSLDYDLCRFQIIAKIPWPNLGSALARYTCDNDPDYYAWETLRTVVQQTGRVCRTPDDTGVTYILDSSFGRLLRRNKDNLPLAFVEGLNYGGVHV